jgi:hypothetical protein
MPRQARLDAPATLHHVMIRGIEGKSILRDNRGRREFVTRLGNLAKETGTRVFSWSLLRNHIHRGVYFRYRQGYSENGGQSLRVLIFHYVP